MVRFGVALVSIASCLTVPLFGQATTLVSMSSGGVQGNGYSIFPSISADGRYVAFVSRAQNLVPGDANGTDDVFVRDRQSNTTDRVSVSSSGAQVRVGVLEAPPSISANGRYVAFACGAPNLVLADTNGKADVFVRDRVLGTTERVSVNSNGAEGNDLSDSPSISADGHYVAFESLASSLVSGDTNGTWDAFVHDRLLGTTELVSVNSSGVHGNGQSGTPSISADGRFVAFTSLASNLVSADTNGTFDVFVRDRQTGTTEIVSLSSSGVQGSGDSYSSPRAISADGRFVAFISSASNLVPSDTNASIDVFVRDRQLGTTELVSVGSSGVEGNGMSYSPAISADGRFVTFQSHASNLVDGDSNGSLDVFVRDRLLGTTERISVSSGRVQGNGASQDPSISADGRYVAFDSTAANLASDTNGTTDVFVRDRGNSSSFSSFCFGDGSIGACPCGNTGSAGKGCQNSAGTGGAVMTTSGTASLSSDSVVLISSNELPTALSIYLQGTSAISPIVFGDGLRCAGGTLERLYSKHASGGSTSVPQTSDPAISARSAALGDTIPLGSTRIYQVYYRDANLVFCGGGFNVSTAIAIAWGS